MTLEWLRRHDPKLDEHLRTYLFTTGSILEIEVVCSDTAEHRRRVEIRAPAVPRPVAPKWESVARREHERWS